MGDSCLKAHLHLSVATEVFIRGRGEQNKEIKGGGCKVLNLQTSTVHSDKASDGLVCIILVQSSWIHVILFYFILTPWLKVSKSPGAGMPKGWSPYLLKLVPRILIQTCCSSTSHTSVRISTYKNKAKEWWGGFNFPLLQHAAMHTKCCSGTRNENRTLTRGAPLDVIIHQQYANSVSVGMEGTWE